MTKTEPEKVNVFPQLYKGAVSWKSPCKQSKYYQEENVLAVSNDLQSLASVSLSAGRLLTHSHS